jgi:two-component system response regulator FixJ
MGRYDGIKATDARFSALGTDVNSSLLKNTQTHAGLSNIYIINSNIQDRKAQHALFSRREDAAVRTYATIDDFNLKKAELEGGCILLFCAGCNETSAFLNSLTGHRQFACILLGYPDNIRSAVHAMKAGAVDYLVCPLADQEIWSAVDATLAYLKKRRDALGDYTIAKERIATLSARELDVLNGLVQGNSNKMIAQELKISPRTIEIYRAHMMDKLGVRSLSEALQYAFLANLPINEIN